MAPLEVAPGSAPDSPSGSPREPGSRAPRASAKRRSRRSNAEATRSRLLEAGRRAFAARGLTGTNLIRDILEPAGVPVGSFYHQFRNKTELLLAILEEDSRDLEAALRRAQEPAPGRSLLDITRDSYTTTFDVIDAHADTIRILFRESAVEDPGVPSFAHQQQQRWIETLTRNFQRLAPADGESARIVLAAELISVLTTGALAHYLRLPEPEREAARERLIDGLVRLTLGGLPALGFDAAALAELGRPRSVNANPTGPSDPASPAEGSRLK